MRSLSIAPLLTLATLLGSGAAFADKVLENPTTGNPGLKSINAISFAPDGVLLVGDGAGSQLLAIETGDTASAPRLAKAISGIDQQLAARLGAKGGGLEILDLAVNPASGKIYFAVRKQDDKSHLILTVDGEGKIGELLLDKVKFVSVPLTAGKVRIGNITDVAWADGKVVAAGRGTEAFASSIFSVEAPLSPKSSGNVYSAETYHVSHRRWETKAPMSVLIPLKEDGKSYVVGAFSCTPVVKYPLDALEPGAQVKGMSMIELGSGNRPIDMIVYEKAGKPYVLSNTYRFHHGRKPFGPSPYWTVKFEQGALAGAENINEKALQRLENGYTPATPRIQLIETYHGVMQLDKLDDAHAVVLRDGEAGLSLEVLPLP